jgi:hypothetical protein
VVFAGAPAPNGTELDGESYEYVSLAQMKDVLQHADDLEGTRELSMRLLLTKSNDLTGNTNQIVGKDVILDLNAASPLRIQ